MQKFILGNKMLYKSLMKRTRCSLFYVSSSTVRRSTSVMNQKNILKQLKTLLIGMLLFCFSQLSVVRTHDESDGLDSREIEPPLQKSGVGDRQSAFRRVLHDQLERLTHAEIRNEHESAEHQRSHEEDEDEDEQHHHHHHHHQEHEEQKYRLSEKKRNYDDEHEYYGGGESHADAEEEQEEEERAYNPWQDSFQDIFEDGTYAYGYNLPNGVTRYERSFYSEKYKGRVVEGFFTQPRNFGRRKMYELRCYRSDYYSGYRQLGVQYLRRQPIVERDTIPDVDCFHKH